MFWGGQSCLILIGGAGSFQGWTLWLEKKFAMLDRTLTTPIFTVFNCFLRSYLSWFMGIGSFNSWSCTSRTSVQPVFVDWSVPPRYLYGSHTSSESFFAHVQEILSSEFNGWMYCLFLKNSIYELLGTTYLANGWKNISSLFFINTHI